MEYDEDLYKLLDNQVDDELKGIVTYDEIKEKLKDDQKNREIILAIQEEQAVHMLQLADMMLGKGMPEPKVMQKIEDWFQAEEKKD